MYIISINTINTYYAKKNPHSCMQILILLSLVMQQLFYEAQQGELCAVQGDNKRTSVLMYNK